MALSWRVGIVGAGGIGRTHAENVAAVDGVRVAAVVDTDVERAAKLAADVGAEAFVDLAPMLDEVDALYVCSPPTLHREHVVASALAGKHVFCEKPLATTLDDGRAIAGAIADARVHAMVGFNNRFRPAFRRVREVARNGDLGDRLSAWILRLARSTPAPMTNWRTTPGLACGITIESAAHDIDLIRWWLCEIDRVSGRTSTSLPELPGYDDTLHALLQLENGGSASIVISWASEVSTSSRGVIGSEGAVHLLGHDMWGVSELRWAKDRSPERVERIEPREGDDLGYRAETEHFIGCVRDDRTPDVTIEDGLVALEVSLSLLESARTGRMVTAGHRD